VGKDYIAFPAVAAVALGRSSAMRTLSGNITANIVRNLWTWAVIFCGHFTDQAHIYNQIDANESKGDWYVRQILGSRNIQGNKWFHILTGNLSHQIEHHIFPDMPARHYQKIAPTVQTICDKYNLPYNTGHFSKQFMPVLGRIYHFSKPSTEEWHAYTQSISNNNSSPKESNNNLASNSTTERLSGFKKFLPQVVRQAMFYA
jgi:linoleoyl-CoA desaturase